MFLNDQPLSLDLAVDIGGTNNSGRVRAIFRGEVSGLDIVSVGDGPDDRDALLRDCIGNGTWIGGEETLPISFVGVPARVFTRRNGVENKQTFAGSVARHDGVHVLRVKCFVVALFEGFDGGFVVLVVALA